MLTTAISLVFLASASNGASPHWLQDLLASPRARNVASQQASRPAKAPAQGRPLAKDGGQPRAPRPAGIHAIEGNVRANPGLDIANETRRAVGRLLDQCRYEDAYAALSAFRGERPDLAGKVVDMAADCAILTGRTEEAYALLTRLVQGRGRKTKTPTRALLSLSLASAGLGQVYPGQADFCRDQVKQGLSRECMSDTLAGRLATSTDSKAVAVLSCLAIGLNFGKSPYLEMALRLDPQNVMAASALVFRYTVQERTADVNRIAGGMLKNLPILDPHRAKFQQALTGLP